IYGGIEARGIHYEGVAEALRVPESDLRLFGKPEAYKKRRMGVALARGDDTAQARERAQACAQRVHPRAYRPIRWLTPTSSSRRPDSRRTRSRRWPALPVLAPSCR